MIIFTTHRLDLCCLVDTLRYIELESSHEQGKPENIAHLQKLTAQCVMLSIIDYSFVDSS